MIYPQDFGFVDMKPLVTVYQKLKFLLQFIYTYILHVLCVFWHLMIVVNGYHHHTRDLFPIF